MKELDGEINRENKGEAEDGWLARVFSPVNCPIVPCYCKPSNWRLVSQRLSCNCGSKVGGVVMSLHPLAQ